MPDKPGSAGGMTLHHLALAAGIGMVIGLLVSAVMTFLDWRLNPGGIFHDAAGTHWNVVCETAVSWWLPTAAVASLAALPCVTWRLRRRGED